MTTQTVIYLLPCAAMPRGCASALAIDGPPGIEMLELDLEVPEDKRVHGLITAAGWRLDHGKWVCPNHPFATPGGPEEVEAAKRAVIERAAELVREQQATERPGSDLDAAIRARLAEWQRFRRQDGAIAEGYGYDEMAAAIEAVLDRHEPNPVADRAPYCEVCVGGYEGVSEWPCETVRDIAKALGVQVPDA